MKPDINSVSIRDVKFGRNVKIIKPVNLYECEIDDDTFIGPFVEVQKNVKIGKHCKIQSHAFICELVTIGDDCFISHGAKFINDKFQEGEPAGGDESKWKKTVIGDNVSIGTNATILPVEICSNTVIGAGAVVTKSISKSGVYVGNPAKLIRPINRN
jgi:acetyltransferase-like isoleucine patch superfamily enzyme